MEFAHLHVHTEYSRDGVASISELAERAAKMGQPGFGVTDHGVLFLGDMLGINSVKIVPGCEVYVIDEKETKRHKASHLTLLALDDSALEALLNGLSYAHTDGFYYLPRISLDVLKELSCFNVVCLSGCLVGYCAKPFVAGDVREAKKRVRLLSEWFGDRFYLEIMPTENEDQERWNRYLVSLGGQYVATCDVHYLDERNYWAYVVKVAGRASSAEARFDGTRDLWMMDGRVVYEQLLRSVPKSVARSAVENTVRIVESAKVEFLKKKNKWAVPSLPFPDRHLRNRVYDALKKGRYLVHYWERVEEELDVIEKKGFAGFFLMVADIIQYARRKGYYVNTRGSGVGSLVLYLLGVTNLDPVKYSIPYWRFISLARDQPPDIDFDFERSKRDEILEYVVRTYGEEYVGHLSNIGRYKEKLLLNDVRRVIRKGYLPVSEDDLQMYLEGDLELGGRSRRVLGCIFDGLREKARFFSVHAGGIVVGAAPLYKFSHCLKTQGQVVVSLDKMMSERFELMKLDMLVVDTLDVLRKACEDGFDPFGIEPGDPKVYKWLRSNPDRLSGVFQLGSRVGHSAVRELKPRGFEDLMTVISVIRPGSSGIETYGAEVPKVFSDILGNTRGAVIYQEQQMQMLRKAGFDEHEIECLIRLNKKLSNRVAFRSEYKSFREKWMRSGLDLPVGLRKRYWKHLMSYGFNRAHAASYAYLSYVTLWMKTYRYIEYMLSCLHFEKNLENVRRIVSELSSLGFQFLNPHINESAYEHRLVGARRIQLGLSALKFVGEKAIRLIVSNSPFDSESWAELVSKNKRLLNARVLKILRESGALRGVER